MHVPVCLSISAINEFLISFVYVFFIYRCSVWTLNIPVFYIYISVIWMFPFVAQDIPAKTVCKGMDSYGHIVFCIHFDFLAPENHFSTVPKNSWIPNISVKLNFDWIKGQFWIFPVTILFSMDRNVMKLHEKKIRQAERLLFLIMSSNRIRLTMYYPAIQISTVTRVFFSYYRMTLNTKSLINELDIRVHLFCFKFECLLKTLTGLSRKYIFNSFFQRWTRHNW